MVDEFRAKREHQRLPVRLDVRVTQVGTESDAELIFETGDLSAGGAFLVSDLLLEVGDEVDLSLELPRADRTLNVRARVAWATRGKNARGAGMGVKFTQLIESDEAALMDYLSGR